MESLLVAGLLNKRPFSGRLFEGLAFVLQLYLCTFLHTLMHLGLQSASSVKKVEIKENTYVLSNFKPLTLRLRQKTTHILDIHSI